MGSNDDAIVLEAGDGTKTSSFIFDTAFEWSPHVVYCIVGADAGTTVAEVVVGSHGVAKVDFAIGPGDGQSARATVRLPVVGRVVKLAVATHHVRLVLHVFENLHAFGHLHGGSSSLSVV